MTDFDAHKARLVQHYVTLAGEPGFKAHAWHAVQELARDWPPQYGDLPELLTKAMKERINEVSQ